MESNQSQPDRAKDKASDFAEVECVHMRGTEEMRVSGIKERGEGVLGDGSWRAEC